MKHIFEYPFKTKDTLELRDNFKFNELIKSDLLFDDYRGQKPTISVVIPTYKNYRTLFEAVESAINQKQAPEYEIVIVDNEADPHNEYIEKLSSYKSARIRYFRNQQNIGLFGNWNRGVELAKADYVVFLHADDLFLDNTLYTLWSLHQKLEFDAGIIGREHELKNGVFHQYSPNRILKVFKQKPYYKLNKCSLFQVESENGCAALYYRSAIIGNGGWNPDSYPSADRSMCINYQLKHPVYRLNSPVRINRIESNESFKCAQQYPASGFYLSSAIVDQHFGGSRILKYIIYLKCISYRIDEFGVKPVRNLRLYEKLICKFSDIVCQISHLF